MVIRNNLALIGSFVIVFFCVQAIILQQHHILLLQHECQLRVKAAEIETAQCDDLEFQLAQMRLTKEITDVKQYVTGVVAAISNPEHYAEVWHAGYDRGTVVQQYADQLEISTYTSAKEEK